MDTTAHCAEIYFVSNFHRSFHSCTIRVSTSNAFSVVSPSFVHCLRCRVQGCATTWKDIGNQIRAGWSLWAWARFTFGEFHFREISADNNSATFSSPFRFPARRNCDNGKQQNWMKYKTSLFSGTNLLKVNVMLDFFLGLCLSRDCCMKANCTWQKSVSPDEAKVDLEMHTCGVEFNFWTRAEGCRFSPPKYLVQYATYVRFNCKKARKMWTRLINAFISMFPDVSRPAAGWNGLGDYQINVCKLVWGGETNDKWLHGHTKLGSSTTKVMERPLQLQPSQRCF